MNRGFYVVRCKQFSISKRKPTSKVSDLVSTSNAKAHARRVEMGGN